MTYSPYLLDAIIREYCPKNRDKLFSYLEDSYEHVSFSKSKWNIQDFSYDCLLSEVHYSWWIKPLQEWEQDAPYFCAILPSDAKKHLMGILSIKTHEIEEKSAQDFLKQTLISTLGTIPIPAEYLPESLMRILLKLSKKQLIFLIDYLAMYDLAFELKHIVDTNILKPLFSFLDKKETAFVKNLSTSLDPFSLGRIHLEKWDKQENSLRQLLHKKGIFRLSIALHNESKDLLWHIAHRLDVGRGSLLLKGYESPVAVSITDSIQASIIELVEGENF
jgi:hypothetical protein